MYRVALRYKFLIIALVTSVLIYHFTYPLVFNYVNTVGGHEFEIGCFRAPGGQGAELSLENRIPEDKQTLTISPSTTPDIFSGIVRTITEDNINSTWINDSWFIYGLHIKNWTNIGSWRIRATDPAVQIVPVSLVPTIKNIQDNKDITYKLRYNEDQQIGDETEVYEKISKLSTPELKLTGLVMVADRKFPTTKIGPGKYLYIDTLSSTGTPIIAEDALHINNKTSTPTPCLLSITAKPVGLNLLIKISLFLVILVIPGRFVVGFAKEVWPSPNEKRKKH